MINNDYTRQIIEEFRANKGKVGGQFARTSLLLLTTTGAKSGQQRITPLGYQTDGDNLIVFASVLGAPNNPAWYHNLIAHPEVTVEVGSDTFSGTATVSQGAERERLWNRALEIAPFLADHQARTVRQIPVIILSRHKG